MYFTALHTFKHLFEWYFLITFCVPCVIIVGIFCCINILKKKHENTFFRLKIVPTPAEDLFHYAKNGQFVQINSIENENYEEIDLETNV